MPIDSDFEINSVDESALEKLFQALIALLNDERDALIHHDGARLEGLSSQKLDVCNQISTQLEAAPDLSKKIALAAVGETQADPQFDPSHVLLAQLATQARDYNLVNGKILHRSQQSVREILGIMSGQSIDGLYGQSGQQDAKGSAHSGAFISA